jgi:xanthosine utilization system XapX-like protein
MYHLLIQNGMEKLFSKTYIKKPFVKRPLFIGEEFNKLCHIGMPSGHAEIITIICTLLYHYKYINLPLCIILIIIISLQRVVSKRHTFTQIIFGMIFGLLYSLLYIKLPYYSIIIVLLIGLLLSNLIINKYKKDMKNSVPDWLAVSVSDIKKCSNQDIFKLYYNCTFQDCIPYITWKELENYLDIILLKIKETNINFDIIIGIKPGGAIISDYISNKLKLINYKINIGDKINYKLKGKNIILIDDINNKTCNYLKKKKKVNIIKSYCILYDKLNSDVDYATNDNILLYPWML